MKKYIRCFDCGELKEAYEVTRKNITLYKCDCKECGSVTTSTSIDHVIDLDDYNEGLKRGYVGGTPGTKCEYCRMIYGEEGHDACLGRLIGVMNACCGHGDINAAYIQFLDGKSIYKEDALIVQSILRKYSKWLVVL